MGIEGWGVELSVPSRCRNTDRGSHGTEATDAANLV